MSGNTSCIFCPAVCLEIKKFCLFFLVFFVFVGSTFFFFFAMPVHDSHEFSEVRIALAIKNFVRTSFTIDCAHSSVKFTIDTLTSLSSLAEDNRLR